MFPASETISLTLTIFTDYYLLQITGFVYQQYLILVCSLGVFVMEYRKFGRSDLTVSVIGLGTAFRRGITQFSLEVIRRSLDLGLKFIDTAEGYNEGKSEELIGKAIAEQPREIIVATKASPTHLSYDDVLKSADGSLTRLNIDTIDLYQIHQPNPKFPIRDTMRAMEYLVDEGKVRHIGVSNFSLNQMKDAQQAMSKYDLVSNQVEYNLLNKGITGMGIDMYELLPYCQKEEIEIIAYRPIGCGILSGKYGNIEEIPKGHIKSSNSYFQGQSFQKNKRIAEELRYIGQKYDRTPAQVALNWLISQPHVVAIPGAENPDQVYELIHGASWKLSEADVYRINNLN